MTVALSVAFLCSCTNENNTEATTSSDVEMETIWSKPQLFEVPSETEISDGSDEEAVMLSEIEKARKVYSLFVSSKPSLDMNDTIAGADGVVYYRITDKNLDTSEKFKNYLLRYFSEQIVMSLLNVQMYVEDENGNMYAVDVGMSDDNVIDYSIIRFEKTESKQTATLEISRDFDSDGKSDSKEAIVFIREPAGVNGEWVFTQFGAF